jgi:hypothetical protein
MRAVGDAIDTTEAQAAEPQMPLWRRAAPWLAAYAALRVGLSLVRLPAGTPAPVVWLALLVVSAAVILLASAAIFAIVRGLPRPGELAQLFIAGGALFGTSLGLMRLAAAGRLGPSGNAVALAAGAAGDVGIICLGAGIGALVAGLIRDRNILLPAGVFAAFADYFMVRWGTVHVALQSHQGAKVVQTMSATVPAVHPSLSPSTMGMADFVFLAFFFACAWRFRMNPYGTFAALVALLAVLLFSIRWLGAFPAVAPMALGFVLVNLRYFKLSRAEIHATAVVFILLAGLVGVFFFLRA